MKADYIRQYLSSAQIELITAQKARIGKWWRADAIVEDVNRFYYIIEGKARLRIGDYEYIAEPGQLFLLQAGLPISFSLYEGKEFSKYWCHFTAKAGEMHLFDMLRVPHKVEMRKGTRTAKRFEALIHYYHSSRLDAPFRIKALLYELLSEFAAHAAATEISSVPGTHKLDAVLAYIDRHLAEPIRVEMLAKLVHLHPNYFMIVFKATLGFTPIGYINNRRMERVQHELLRTDKGVSEIAAQVGMECSYLSRQFKKHTGLSPREYRRQRKLK